MELLLIFRDGAIRVQIAGSWTLPDDALNTMNPTAQQH